MKAWTLWLSCVQHRLLAAKAVPHKSLSPGRMEGLRDIGLVET